MHLDKHFEAKPSAKDICSLRAQKQKTKVTFVNKNGQTAIAMLNVFLSNNHLTM